MKVVRFTQGSSEWLSWRKNGIGASDISVLMGSNPYLTPLQLWEMKCGYREEDKINEAMQHGIDTEPIARKWLNDNHKLNLTPLCIEDNEFNYMRASLDAYDEKSNLIAEIKCPVSEKTLDKAREYQTIHKYWYHQMQWQMMLTNPKRALCALWDYRHNNCITIEMFGNSKLHEDMKERAKQFWRQVQSGKAPVTQDKDYIHIEDEKLQEYLKEYKQILDGEKVLYERKKVLKPLIAEFGDDGNFKAYGYTVTRHPPRVVYNLDQMRIDGINVDLYATKKNEIGYYVIKPPKF